MTNETTKRAVRHFSVPPTLAGKLAWLRFSIARRVLQIAILALFIGTARLGWTVAGRPLLSGDLSSSLFAGLVPLSDPFAVLQKLCAGHAPEFTMILGGLIVIALYAALGGRAFCAWVCPMNMVTDAAGWLRARLGIRSDWIRISASARYALAAGCLAASAITGAAAFEWFSPQALLWREAVWGAGLGLASAVAGVFALDLLVLGRGWCGHLCPLGAFWALVGEAGLVKPLFDDAKCTRCGDCLKVCPEPQVINFKRAAAKGFIAPGACTNCGRCVATCPEKALHFGLRFAAKPSNEQDSSSR